MAFHVRFLFLRIFYIVVHINILFLFMIQRQPFLTYCFWFLRVISIFLKERFSSWFMNFIFTLLTPYYERWRKIVSLLYLDFSFLVKIMDQANMRYWDIKILIKFQLYAIPQIKKNCNGISHSFKADWRSASQACCSHMAACCPGEADGPEPRHAEWWLSGIRTWVTVMFTAAMICSPF